MATNPNSEATANAAADTRLVNLAPFMLGGVYHLEPDLLKKILIATFFAGQVEQARRTTVIVDTALERLPSDGS
jgi:hypothetical protein